MNRVVGVLTVIGGLVRTGGLSAHHEQHAAGAKPDHMDHRFDDADRWAADFDDLARDAAASYQ